MANTVYGLAKQAFGSGNIDWINDNVKAVLVDTASYTANFTTDEFLDDIPAGARKGTTAALTGKATTLGALIASSATWTAVAAGSAIEAVVFFIDTGTESTSRLIGYYDTATGLPITPNGQDIALVLPGTGVFQIG